MSDTTALYRLYRELEGTGETMKQEQLRAMVRDIARYMTAICVKSPGKLVMVKPPPEVQREIARIVSAEAEAIEVRAYVYLWMLLTAPQIRDFPHHLRRAGKLAAAAVNEAINEEMKSQAQPNQKEQLQ